MKAYVFIRETRSLLLTRAYGGKKMRVYNAFAVSNRPCALQPRLIPSAENIIDY